MSVSIRHLVFGRPLAESERESRKITAVEGLPAMGLDGLSSASYGPEAMLTALLPFGALGLAYLGWIMAPILALLGVLYVSYRQTLRAYPNNGGAYVVARENLGANASLLAAAAIMIDYVLNVAVGISAGIGALTSAVPAVHPYTLGLCLATLVIVTMVNLRGTLDAGRVFALPTYAFVLSLLSVIAIGCYRTFVAHGHPQALVAPATVPPMAETLSVLLLVQAFAAGCTAMTGVEAVSNGVGAFKQPAMKRAQRTLAAICGLLGLLLAGIAYLCNAYGISATDQTQHGYQSILSQLTAAIVGHGVFYYVTIASALCVLCLSANTSFVAFPRLCRIVAQDGFLPRQFAATSRRWVCSFGILFLAATAGLLLVAFRGITDRLIPLFALGAFLTFTLSQLGMVIHWKRALAQALTAERRHKFRRHLFINLVGAMTTALVSVIIVVAKFFEGAWITVVVIPVVVLSLKTINRHYRKRRADGNALNSQRSPQPLLVVAVGAWNRLTTQALQFAMRLSSDVVAVRLGCEVLAEPRRNSVLKERWHSEVVNCAAAAGYKVPEVVLLPVPDQEIQTSLLRYVEELARKYPYRTIAVLIPDLLMNGWWQALLNMQRFYRLRFALRHANVVVLDAHSNYAMEPAPIRSRH